MTNGPGRNQARNPAGRPTVGAHGRARQRASAGRRLEERSGDVAQALPQKVARGIRA